MFKVTEIFYSIQGEGKSQGNPSIFVRFWGCNFYRYGGCSFCDSKSSWEHGREDAEDYSTSRLIDTIKSLVPYNVLSNDIDVVFTGGEPLLWVNDSLIEVLNSLRFYFNDIYFETNGTLDIERFGHTLEFVKFNCSPKTSNSGLPYDVTVKPEILKRISEIKGSCFKFVLSSSADFVEILRIVHEVDIPMSMCYLMPEGTTRKEIETNLKTCAEYSKLFGMRVSNRFQVQIYDNVMGV